MKKRSSETDSAFQPNAPLEIADSAFALETSGGAALYPYLSQVDLAHAIGLIDAGLLPRETGARLLEGLLELDAIAPETFGLEPARGDLYTNRLHALRARIGSDAAWLSAGRARREATTTAYLMCVRSGIVRCAEGLVCTLAGLVEHARDHVVTLMPDYTYLQPAHPTTWGHYLLTFASPIPRDLARLELAFRHADESPAGSGSTNGSALPLDRDRLAERLGFERVRTHTRDAMWSADGPIEILAALVTAFTNLGRLADDLLIFTTEEFGYLRLASEHTRGSVIMPQKRNPYALSYLRGLARELPGHLVSTAAHQATPSGQVDNRIHAYSHVPQTLETAARALTLLTRVIQGLQVFPDRMAERAREGLTGMTDLAEAVMRRHGLDWETAHGIVHEAVAQSRRRGTDFFAEDLNDAGTALGHPLDWTSDEVDATLAPDRLVASRTGPGGASRGSLETMLNELDRSVAEGAAWVARRRGRSAQASERLIEDARERCRST